ncbi:hypothetical protein BaRGS_00002880 [Batillaria attramentaria]|uniref:Uncharacterized protein n=1 Tax=Batillaria attramentaria TaxID=370345 RepID=A0ABD0M113_9CAEN
MSAPKRSCRRPVSSTEHFRHAEENQRIRNRQALNDAAAAQEMLICAVLSLLISEDCPGQASSAAESKF